MDTHKTCKYCLDYKPNNKRFFPYRLSKDGDSGRLGSICIACKKIQDREQLSMDRVVKRTACLTVDADCLFSANGDDAIYC